MHETRGDAEDQISRLSVMAEERKLGKHPSFERLKIKDPY